MRQGIASRTALRVAMRRAAHQLLDHPPVFPDPLALRIIGDQAAAEVRRQIAEPETVASRNLRAFMAVRSRLAEDALAQAVERGASQYVILGAGLDTFAYRNPYEGLKVFEVDHPATQAWKREMLAAAAIPVPQSLRFVPVDFERQNLATELAAAGFDPGKDAGASFFSWLGVVPYLTRQAFEETARYIATAAGQVVFDYAVSPSLLNPAERAALEALSRRVEKAGEPFRLFFNPAELHTHLTAAGFITVNDWDTPALNARYFHPRADTLRLLGAAGRIIIALA